MLVAGPRAAGGRDLSVRGHFQVQTGHGYSVQIHETYLRRSGRNTACRAFGDFPPWYKVGTTVCFSSGVQCLQLMHAKEAAETRDSVESGFCQGEL